MGLISSSDQKEEHMAHISAQSVAKVSQYQIDGINNIQENGGGVRPGDGSFISGGGQQSESGGVGNSPNIDSIPQPGAGWPTGRDEEHSSGLYPRLNDAILQRNTNTVANQGSATPVGFAVTADPHAYPGTQSLQNSLLNDVSAMRPVNAGGSGMANPTPAGGSRQSDGLSQAPSHE